MRTSRRPERVAQQIKRELSEIIQRNEIKDDRLGGLVSVTEVEVSGDLRSVKVYISIYGEESQRVGTIAALNNARGFLRGEICRRLGLRFAPELVFNLDDSLERGQKITELLEKIKNKEV